MALPSRVLYTLTEAAARWGCVPADIAGWALVGRIEIMTGISPVMCGVEQVGGVVAVAAADILPMFRRCGTGPTTLAIRRIKPSETNDWKQITTPDNGVAVAFADLVLLGAEVQRFEQEFDLLQKANDGAGPAGRYDWDAFYLAVIERVHEHGLPETQGAFVAEMQEWFVARNEDGPIPDQSTIRRRISPIWAKLRQE